MKKQIYELTCTRTFLSDKKMSMSEMQECFDNGGDPGWRVDEARWVGESVEYEEAGGDNGLQKLD